MTEITPDGSPVLLYRRLAPGDEPSVIASAVDPSASLLELGCGAGRITNELVSRGYRVTAVDESSEMLAWVRGAETVHARIEDLDLARTFDAVILGSHLINIDDDTIRASFLAACRRHVDAHGSVLVEHYPVDWEATVAESETRIGDVTIALREVRSTRGRVSAVAEYTVEGQSFRQPFTARVLDEAELSEQLGLASLRLDMRVTRTWLKARPTTA